MTAQLEGVVSTDTDLEVISVTFSHTVPVMTDGILIVNATWNNRQLQTVASVTFDGDPLTFIGQVTEDDDTRVEQWRLLAPAAKTADVVITLTATLATDEGICSAAMNFSGVDQTTPIGNIATASSSGSGTASVNINSSVGELVLDGCGTEVDGGPLVVGPGQTQLYNLSAGVGAREEHSGGSTEPGAATVTMSWTLDASDRWGIIAMELLSAAAAVPPTVDAGGPYSGVWSALEPLNATVTPGSDPSPTLLWTIDSGGFGFFSDDTIEDPTFQPFSVGPYVLRLTVTPNDGPAVFDTATFDSLPLAPTIDAGGPYSGNVGVQTQLDGTLVSQGSTGDITYKWTIDSGGAGSFSDDTVLDPLFTPNDVGPYVLRLTATAADGPTPFDTATFTTTGAGSGRVLNGRLIQGGTGQLIMSQLALGADPPVDTVFVKGTATASTGEMYVAVDDGVVPRVFIAGIAHQHNGVRLVTFNPPVVNLNAWGLDVNGAQGIATAGSGFAHEGVLLDPEGKAGVDGVTPGPGPTPTPFPQPAAVIHDFDFGDQSQMVSGAAFNFPTTDGDPIARISNKGSDGTPLEYSGVALDEGPLWIQNPTGLPNGSGAARFDITKNAELFANIVADPGQDLTVAMIFKGMEEPSPGMRQMYWGSPGSNALGVAYRAPTNNTGSTLLRGQIASGDAAFQQINSFDWYMIVGSVDSVGNFVSQRTGAVPFTGVLGGGTGPGPNKTFRLGDRSTQDRQYGGDIARVWVWDAALNAAEVQQMLDWGDENYGPFSYNGVPTLPPIQNDFLWSVSVPFSSSDDVSGLSPDILSLNGTSWDIQGIYEGDTIEQNAALSQNVDMVGKYLVEKVYHGAAQRTQLTVQPNLPGPFGPYVGIDFGPPPPYIFVLDLYYDSTEDNGLLALGLTLNWASTLISLPTDGVSNWQSYGVTKGDIIRFENSLNHGPLDIRVRGFQGVQGEGDKDIQIPTSVIGGLPYLGADVADVRLIKRATK